jgi:hypothetical protein
MNALMPLWYHDEASKTPAAKGVPVRVRRDTATAVADLMSTSIA